MAAKGSRSLQLTSSDGSGTGYMYLSIYRLSCPLQVPSHMTAIIGSAILAFWCRISPLLMIVCPQPLLLSASTLLMYLQSLPQASQ